MTGEHLCPREKEGGIELSQGGGGKPDVHSGHFSGREAIPTLWVSNLV